MKQHFCLLIAILFFGTAQAQTDSSKEKQKIKFKLGLNYNSHLNYYGRTDSLKSTGIFPLAEVWLAKDFYVNAAPVFVSNAVQNLDYAGTVATLGYLHVGKKWIPHIYLLKPFYEKSSQLVQSALKAQSGANFTFLNKIVNLTAGADAKLSDKMDYGATAGVDHIIRKEMKNKSVLVINPSFYAYAGTQNFTNTYYKQNQGFLFFPGSAEQVSENVQQFNVLAYEFSMPVIYAKNKWMLLVTPSYILPQNLIEVSGGPDLSERGKNMFYATVALKHSF